MQIDSDFALQIVCAIKTLIMQYGNLFADILLYYLFVRNLKQLQTNIGPLYYC
jgi:hypothetical protein